MLYMNLNLIFDDCIDFIPILYISEDTDLNVVIKAVARYFTIVH